MSVGDAVSGPPVRRLDQWLWFARFAKSRSLAARWCGAGAVTVNGAAIRKPNHAVRIGDVVGFAQGPWQREVRVVALGMRRGPAAEARRLYDEAAPPVRRPAGVADWVPLLGEE